MSKGFKWAIFSIVVFVGLFLGVGAYLANQKSFADSQAASENLPKFQSYIDMSNFDDVVQIVESEYPDLKQYDLPSEKTVKFVAEDVSPEFKKGDFWYGIKVIQHEQPINTVSVLIEVYDPNSYEDSKTAAFYACKNLGAKFSPTIAPKIEELEKRLKENEQEFTPAKSVSAAEGFRVDLNASNFNDGYPIVCQISKV